MKIRSKLLAVIFAAILAASVFVGCSPSEDNGLPTELEDGTITYANGTCESIIGVADSGTVATAVASNGAAVSYSIEESEAKKLGNAFDNTLSIATDGAIKGAAAKLDRKSVV